MISKSVWTGHCDKQRLAVGLQSAVSFTEKQVQGFKIHPKTATGSMSDLALPIICLMFRSFCDVATTQ